MKILIGDVNEVNKDKLDTLKKGYYQQYIKEFISLSNFNSWMKSVSKPIMGGNFLIILNDKKTYIRNAMDMINKLNHIEECHPYIDIIWMPSNSTKFTNLAIKEEVINLNRTFVEDFKSRIMQDIPMLSLEGLKELISRIGYNWNTYLLYRSQLMSSMPNTASEVAKIVKVDKIKPADDILIMIIKRQRFAVHNYNQLCRKYSEQWAQRFFADKLDKIIETKLKLAKKEINLYKVRNIKGMSKFFDVILNTPICDIFLLRNCIKDILGVKLYTSYSTVQLIDYYRDLLEKGVDKANGLWKF